MPRADAGDGPLTFDGVETPAAPGAESIMAPTGDSLTDPNEPFLPSLTSGQFDGLFGTTTLPAAPKTDQVGVSASGGTGSEAIAFAKSLIGTPYVWGGTSSRGVDCSGLVQLAFQHAGISLPRISSDQARSGTRVGLKQLRPGDLVAWDNSARNNGADHIAIYIGNGQIIEAARPGTNVRMRKLGADEGAWGVRLG